MDTTVFSVPSIVNDSLVGICDFVPVCSMWSCSLVSQVVVHHDLDLFHPLDGSSSSQGGEKQTTKGGAQYPLRVTGVAYNGRNHYALK